MQDGLVICCWIICKCQQTIEVFNDLYRYESIYFLTAHRNLPIFLFLCSENNNHNDCCHWQLHRLLPTSHYLQIKPVIRNKCLSKNALKRCFFVSYHSHLLITYDWSDNTIKLLEKNISDDKIVQQWSIKSIDQHKRTYIIWLAISNIGIISWNYDTLSCTMQGN